MSQLGMGAMIHYLSGGSDIDAKTLYGKKITAAKLDEDANKLRLEFGDGTKVAIWDNGQSCCESRYMRTDDDVSELVGKTLVRIETKDTASIDDGEVHDICFVEIQAKARTKVATITIANHNEHNGYYGGFGLTITSY